MGWSRSPWVIRVLEAWGWRQRAWRLLRFERLQLPSDVGPQLLARLGSLCSGARPPLVVTG